MKIIFLLLGLCGSFSVNSAEYSRIESKDTVLHQVIQSIQKHELTSLSIECLSFILDDKETFYSVEVREKHNLQCGGDERVSPRLFTFEVDKRTGKMRTDEPIWTGEMREID